MKVALSVETFYPKIDGISNITALTLDYLISYGIECILFAPSHCSPDYKGVEIIRLPGIQNPKYPEGMLCFPTPKVLTTLLDFKPDLVHVIDPGFIGAGVGIPAVQMGIPTIASYHLDLSQQFRDFGLGFLAGTIDRMRMWGFNYVSHALAPSRRAQRYLQERGIKRVGWWRRGVDAENFHPSFRDEAMRTRLTDGHSERTILLYVGRLSPAKGLEILHEAMQRLGNENVHLALVGDGPLRSQLESQFEGMPVTFVGYLRGEELASAYASADIFSFASDHESFGMVLAEAAASGLPIVSSRVGGAEDVIHHNESGYIFEVGDSEAMYQYLLDLVNDPEKRAAWGKKSRQIAESLNWDDIMREFIYFYEDILREKGKTPNPELENRPLSPLYIPKSSKGLAS